MAAAIWGKAWERSVVQFHSDNQAVVTSGYSRHPRVQHLLRCLFFITAMFDVSVQAVHVPGLENGGADAISRNNIPLLLLLHPQASPVPTHLPQELVRILVVDQPDWTSPAWRGLFRNCFQRDWPTPLGRHTGRVALDTSPSVQTKG